MHQFIIALAHTRISFSLKPLQQLFYAFLIKVILTALGWYLIAVLMCVSLITSNVEHFFMCLMTTYMSSLGAIQILCPFLIVFFILHLCISLYFWISISYQRYNLQITSSILWVTFSLCWWLPLLWKAFSLM